MMVAGYQHLVQPTEPAIEVTLRRPRHTGPPEGSDLGEVDDALGAFWYRDLLRPDSSVPLLDPDWGIHVNADRLVEWSAVVATMMDADGVPNSPDMALDLCFIFGFDHEYRHHAVDSEVTMHQLRSIQQGGEAPQLRHSHRERSDSAAISQKQPEWWLLSEETYANAAIIRDQIRLGGLKEAFLRYGLLPQPLDLARGPYSLWEAAAMDEQCFQAACAHVWMQHLSGELDPLGLIPRLDEILKDGGAESAHAVVLEKMLEALQVSEVEEDLSWLADRQGVLKMVAFGGFRDGLLRRLQVPVHFHGANNKEVSERYDTDNGDWPYGTIERLYTHFRTTELSGEWDDPFSDDDDGGFELTP